MCSWRSVPKPRPRLSEPLSRDAHFRLLARRDAVDLSDQMADGLLRSGDVTRESLRVRVARASAVRACVRRMILARGTSAPVSQPAVHSPRAYQSLPSVLRIVNSYFGQTTAFSVNFHGNYGGDTGGDGKGILAGAARWISIPEGCNAGRTKAPRRPCRYPDLIAPFRHGGSPSRCVGGHRLWLACSKWHVLQRVFVPSAMRGRRTAHCCQDAKKRA